MRVLDPPSAEKAKPLAIDLCCGLGGWTEGLLAEGWDVIGYDIEEHVYGEERYPARLVVQDILTLHGSALKDAALIVASPPCQEFSYMAMPWKRAKQIARALRGKDDEFPEGYKGSRTITELTALFDACFRIKAEASAAAGHDIPLVVENVKGAQPWVGRAKWSFGSYFLWGDVPALMPIQKYHQRLKCPPGEQWNVNRENFSGTNGWDEGLKCNPDGTTHGQGSWFKIADSKNRGLKNTGGSWFNVAHNTTSGVGNNPVGRKVAEGVKVPSDAGRRTAPGTGARFTSVERAEEGRKQKGSGREWFAGEGTIGRTTSSHSPARKAASAKIAKIPFALSSWIARCYYPALLTADQQET